MNTTLLKSIMTKNNDTQKTLAEFLGLSLSRLNAKINETGGAGFNQHEIAAIVERYHLTGAEAMDVFFAKEVSD